MGRILTVLIFSFLVAVSTASAARILHQEANETAAAGTASSLAEAIEDSKTTANVSYFIYAWEAGEVETLLTNFTDDYTVLVPTNDAIAAALPLINVTLDQILSGDEASGAAVAALLAYHILPEGTYTKRNLARYVSITPVLSLIGYPEAGNLTVTAPNGPRGNVTLIGANNSTATVILQDIKANRAQRRRLGEGKDFIAHIVDGVLLPPAEVLANATTLDADNATTLPGNATLAPDAGPEDNTTLADAGDAEGNATTPAAVDATGTNATTPAEGTPIGVVVPANAANVSAPVLAESIGNGTGVAVVPVEIPSSTGSPAPGAAAENDTTAPAPGGATTAP